MRREHSAISHNIILVNCAFLAAAVTLPWFRTSNIHLFINLFADFLHYQSLGRPFDMQAVQISRKLEVMAKKKLVQSRKQESKRFFKISDRGALALLSEIVNLDRCLSIEEVLLVRYIFTSYSEVIQDYIRSSHECEADKIKGLDFNAFVRKQHSMLLNAVREMRENIQNCDRICSFLEKKGKERPFDEDFIKDFSRKFPFRLSHIKPLNELYEELPIEFVKYELMEGFHKRQKRLFEPLVRRYEKLAQDMQALLNDSSWSAPIP